LEIVCLDLEGVLIPEIWVEFAEHTGIKKLAMTTRDIPIYEDLMDQRLSLLKENRLTVRDIQAVIGKMKPLPGAVDFLNQIRSRYQVVILSDTFYEFAVPLMEVMGWPTLLCHRLVCDKNGYITDYKIRQPDAKKQAVKGFHELNFKVLAAGDSYNDIKMLEEADIGFLFCPPHNVKQEFPQFQIVRNYTQLKNVLEEYTMRTR